jgi:hypothetical protein
VWTSFKEEITQIICKHSKAVTALYPMLRDKHINIDMKREIHNTILTPNLLYGAETWATTLKDESGLQSAEMRTLRAIVGKTKLDKIRNEKIRQQIGVNPVFQKFECSCLRWLGCLVRMPEQCVAKIRWKWEPKGTRPRGRPRMRWKDSVSNTLKRHQLPSL